MKNKFYFLFLFLIIIFPIYSEEDGERFTPRQRIEQLLNNDYRDDRTRRAALIEAAEIRQITGDLTSAAELFEQASLAVKGQKDFYSLYRAAVLNTEMANYRKAEADLRAIILFSDDSSLRLKASVLTVRIKLNQGDDDEALELLGSIMELYPELPSAAAYYAAGTSAAADYDEASLARIAAYIGEKSLLTPELVFGGYEPQAAVAAKEPVPEADENLTAAGVQLGSFSQNENAEEMKKVIIKLGYDAEVREKNVNDRSYFSVVVPVAEDQSIQELLIELKEKGYEGYPVY